MTAINATTTKPQQINEVLVNVPLADENAAAPAQNYKTMAGFYKMCDDYLIMPKILYFTINCCVYSTHMFLAKFLKDELGFKDSEVGFVAALSFVNFFGAMFWSFVADKSKKHKLILVGCTFLYALFFAALYLARKEMNLFQDKWATLLYSMAMYGCSSFAVSALFPLLDSLVVALLNNDPRFNKEMFGRQRLWGSVGHALISIVNGAVMSGSSSYTGMFIVLAASSTLFAFLVFTTIPNDLSVTTKGHGGHHHGGGEEKKEKEAPVPMDTLKTVPVTEKAAEALELERNDSLPASMRADIDARERKFTELESGRRGFIHSPTMRLILNPHFLFFLLVVLVAGFNRSVLSVYLGDYLESAHKKDKLQASLTTIFRGLSEVAVFFYGKDLIRKFGVHWMILVGLLTGVLRVGAYALLPTHGDWFYVSFVIELLKGINAACLISGCVRLANDIAPKELRTSAQGLFSGVYQGLSTAVGSIVGGLLMHALENPNDKSFNFKWTFGITSLVSLLFFVLCIVKYGFIDRVLSFGCVKRR